jgi:hypothetical protein
VLPRRHRPVSRRAFQAVALLTLALPFAAAAAVEPHLPRLGVGTALALPLRVLLAALALLGFVLAWALALLPLRRRSRMPTLAEELARADVRSFAELYARARNDLASAESSPDPARRRRRHLSMAAAGGGVTVLLAGVCALLWASNETVVVEAVVALVVSAGLALYHAARALRRA